MDQRSVFMMAGEASSDLHGAKVLGALRATIPDVFVFGVGGNAMKRQNMHCIVESSELSLVGIVEVVKHLPRVFRILKRLQAAIVQYRPKVAILLDMPDINLRLAKFCKQLGIKVVYYIGPQVWAWRSGRIHQIKKWVDRMLVILPFEADFYRQHAMPAEFVGHPLMEDVAQTQDLKAAKVACREELGLAGNQACVALLPGSRVQEIRRHLPVMLQTLALLQRDYPALQAVLPVAHTVSRAQIERMLPYFPVNLKIVDEQALTVLRAADFSIICSGTATLQAALAGCPMVIVYRGAWLSYWIVRLLVRIRHIGLANIIANKTVVPELIQSECYAWRLFQTVRLYIEDHSYTQRVREALLGIRECLSARRPSLRVAEVVKEYIL